MANKKLFKGTTLHLKIKKSEDVDTKKAENFVQLCQFFNLSAEAFNPNDPSPWRELAQKMMEHLVPAFKMNSSGRKKQHCFASDDQIAVWLDFEVEPKEERLRKEEVHRLAKMLGISDREVMHARDRAAKARKELKEKNKSPYDNDLEEYFTRKDTIEWANSARKKETRPKN